MSWRSTAVEAAMEKVHFQSPEVVYTRHRVVRIMDFPPAFAALSFSPDWTRSFIDRWEGSHDGRLCNLSFVSPPRMEEENLREEEQRAERTSNGAEKRTIIPLRSVPNFFLSSLYLAPLLILSSFLLSLSFSFF